MKNIKKTIILILALCSFIGAYSQTKTIIRGKVIDQKDKSGVIGATVVESDKENRVVNGTITDIDGNFVYQMKNPANTMKVTVIGYQTKTFKPDPTKSVTIELVSSDIELDQVVVTAKQKSDNSLTNIDERNTSSARVKVDLMEMKDAGITSAEDALQGKISGLDIISASGDPGSGSQIVIRGLSSIGNNKPLIVIDGIAQDAVPSSFDLGSSDAEDISNMINVALQDIKSIEVLKDAASTAVYGSKGADGVLLIETHRGKMGKVQFDYTYKNSMNFQPPAIPMLNGDEYVTLQLEQLHNSQGVFDLPREIAYDKDFPDFYNYSANTDWLGAITQNSMTHDHYFKISGGGEKTRYFTSFSYVDEGGTTINTGRKSFSTRVNLDYYLSKKILVTLQFNYFNNQRDGNYVIKVDGWRDRNVRQMAYMKAPNMSIYEHDAYGNLTGEYFTRNFDKTGNYQGDGFSYYNPVAVANLGKNDESTNELENTFKLKYSITDWLTFKESVSFSYTGRKSNRFLPYNAIGANWYDWTVNKADEGNGLFSSFKTESMLSFFVPFTNTKHEFSGSAVWQTNQTTDDQMLVESNRIPSINIQDPAIDAHVNWISSSLVEKRDLGALINANYIYGDRYGLTYVARMDANSSFGSANRWGMFHGVSGFWRFSSEPLLESWSHWMGESKIRASWGTSGKAPGDWPQYPRFAIYKSGNGYLTNPSVVPTSIQLDNLKWQGITQTNFGIDLNLFKDKLYFTGEIYNKVTSDLLFPNYDIPSSSGYGQLVYLNGGEVTNKGWEMMADYTIFRTKDWRLKVDFNVSQNINSFTKLPENFNNEKDISISPGKYPKRIVEGEPIGSFFGFRYKGVYATDQDAIARDAEGNQLFDGAGNKIPMTYKGTYIFKGGDAKYEDINHDGNIDINDVVYIGDSNPSVTGGFGSAIRYKQFDFSFQFYYRLGFDIINGTAIQTEGMDGRNNQSKAVLNRWRVQGQDEVGLLPRAYMNNPANNLGSDRYVEEGDFMRLNNVSLKYQLSQAMCSKLNLQSASFSLSARKLITFTNYSGQDPEINQNAGDPFWIGVDEANTPPPRMVTMTFSVGF